MAKVHVFKNGTNLRRTGLLETGNIIGTVDAGDHEALHQCQGDDVKEGSDVNNWWVKIVVGSRAGWVSAVRIDTGGNDDPVPGVPTRPVEWA